MARNKKGKTKEINMDDILADVISISKMGELEEGEFTTRQFMTKWNMDNHEQITMHAAHKKLERLLGAGIVTKRVPRKLAYWRKVEVEDGDTDR
jgi:hypothetical protein